MNLYDVYTADMKECLIRCKTSGEIADQLGVLERNVYKAAHSGYILDEKYKVRLVINKPKSEITEFDLKFCKEWGEVTDQLRRHFPMASKKNGKK